MTGVVVGLLHKYFSAEHLAEVKVEMETLGAPRLRGFYDRVGGIWLMREGCHRLRAAHALGLTPILVGVPWWRRPARLDQARHAAIEYGLTFPTVVEVSP